jgi:hypothetical protein
VNGIVVFKTGQFEKLNSGDKDQLFCPRDKRINILNETGMS